MVAIRKSNGLAGGWYNELILRSFVQTSANPLFFAISGRILMSATEADHEVNTPFAMTFQNFTCRISGNSYLDTCRLIMRQNGANSALVITIGAGLTGNFFDNVNTIPYAQGDIAVIRVETDEAVAHTLTILSFGYVNRFP